jgi:hypothetical protein
MNVDPSPLTASSIQLDTGQSTKVRDLIKDLTASENKRSTTSKFKIKNFELKKLDIIYLVDST